jgi:hypothetical protein
LLVPVVFWPGRRGHPSLYSLLGEPDWMVWVFIVPFTGAILFQFGTTRATGRDTATVESPEHCRDL